MNMQQSATKMKVIAPAQSARTSMRQLTDGLLSCKVCAACSRTATPESRHLRGCATIDRLVNQAASKKLNERSRMRSFPCVLRLLNVKIQLYAWTSLFGPLYRFIHFAHEASLLC